ncbi:efflux RND transporter periplasmic adaptor subunit [Roseicitreum antarcticum]|uniref:HlyD family secretion protein n=1 Tax=Roseicitreum antarcticum TaxID=564137 RepID=A0A1H2RK82_9RHOB|nr:HlyD family efflux transporter periplasmic adaptor subunit [Roseicitreum antarcticum]SDW19715.1 HlyD family secretion protein [Roseicitreum antarcticum]
MRFLTRSLLGLLFMALSLGLLAYAGYTVMQAAEERAQAGDRPRTARERVFTVPVATLTPGAIAPELVTFGEVRARRALDLRVAVAGRVEYLAPGFEDGAQVAAGQVLVRLDPADATAARDLTASDLARAEAELRDAVAARELAREDVAAARDQAALRERALVRRQDLAARGVSTDAATEEAELAASSARQSLVARRQAEAQAVARVAQAETALTRQRISLDEAERRLADTVLRAGFDGTLADVAVSAGGLVGGNEQIGQLIDPDDLEIAFRVSTAQYLRLLDTEGALLPLAVDVSLDVSGTQIVSGGVLDRVSASVGEGQSGRLIYARMDAARGFRPGDFVRVAVHEPALEGVAMLPATALGAGDEVLVVTAEDRLEAATVDVLRRQGDAVIVRVGNLAGRDVVTERGPMLGAGIAVRVLRQDGAGGDVPPDAGLEAAGSSAGDATAETAGAEGSEAARGDRAGSDTARPTGAARNGAGAAAPAASLVTLDPAHRARLIALVEGNAAIPAQARSRILAQLSQDQVPARVIERVEQGGGGAPRQGG